MFANNVVLLIDLCHDSNQTLGMILMHDQDHGRKRSFFKVLFVSGFSHDKCVLLCVITGRYLRLVCSTRTKIIVTECVF